MEIDTSKDFTQFIGQTIRSKAPLENSGSIGYFWATFDDTGIKFGQGSETYKPNTFRSAHLNKSALSDSKATFKDGVSGTISFIAPVDTGKINSILVEITSGTSYGGTASYDGQKIDCQFVN